MSQRRFRLPRTPFEIAITVVAVLLLGAMLYLILRTLFVDFGDYRPVEATGTIVTQTPRGRRLLRITDAQGATTLIVCDARGRSGMCLMPAVHAGLVEGGVATVTYLAPPKGALFAEPVVVQIEQDGRALLDCAQRLRTLEVDRSTTC
jgi:hypothetical protein